MGLPPWLPGPVPARRSRAPFLCTSILGLALGLAGCAEEAGPPSSIDPAPRVGAASAGALVFIQISRGTGHGCGVTEENVAYCWGVNNHGQLGTGTKHTGISPLVPVSGGLRFRHVSAGSSHSCGITTDRRAYCWGFNFDGQLGDGTGYPTNTERLTPVAVAGGRQFRQVRAGHNHTCALTPADAAFCWGKNDFGKLGDGTTATRFEPVRVHGGHDWAQLSAGREHTCAVTLDSRAYCWGRNVWGQLGDGSVEQRIRPVAVTGGVAFRQINAGAEHTCAVTPRNLAYCWGFDGDGQLGDGAEGGARSTPAPVAGTRRFDHVSTRDLHTCGVTLNQRAFCWGYNGQGQLGDGTTTDRSTPVAVKGGLYFEQVSAGNLRTCGRTPEGKIYCWDENGLVEVS